jgi:hypothetical protein
MRKILEEKQVSFKDTAFTGKHLDDLIRLLYRYRDRIATKLTDLEASDTLLFRIDTGDALPIRNRGFRRTPEEKQQIRNTLNNFWTQGSFDLQTVLGLPMFY